MKVRWGKNKKKGVWGQDMTITWENEDIRPGRMVSKLSPDFTEGTKNEWVISCVPEIKYFLISLNNGEVTTPKTKEELAKMLSEDRCIPTILLR